MVKKIVVLTMPYEAHPLFAGDAKEHFSARLGEDYIVFVIQGIKGQEAKFELFTDEKIKPIEIEELKTKLMATGSD